MDVIIQLANDFFKPILAMGGPIIMEIVVDFPAPLGPQIAMKLPFSNCN